MSTLRTVRTLRTTRTIRTRGCLVPGVLVGLMLAGCVLPVSVAGQAPPDPDGARVADGEQWDRLLRAAYARDPGLAPYFVEALVARGIDPAGWPAAEDAVLGRVDVPDEGPLIRAVRAMHALAVAGQLEPQHLARIHASHDGLQYGDPTLRNDDIWALRTLAAADAVDDPARQTASALLESQDPTGGWSWAVDGRPDVDTTGMAAETLQGMHLLDVEAAEAAIRFLLQHQAADGGFLHAVPVEQGGSVPAAGGNCNSTVWGVRGLSAATMVLRGEQGAEADTSTDVENALARAWQYMEALRTADGFAFRPGEETLPLCTLEALTLFAASDRPLPAPPAPTHDAPSPALFALVLALFAAVAVSRASSFRDHRASSVLARR